MKRAGAMPVEINLISFLGQSKYLFLTHQKPDKVSWIKQHLNDENLLDESRLVADLRLVGVYWTLQVALQDKVVLLHFPPRTSRNFRISLTAFWRLHCCQEAVVRARPMTLGKKELPWKVHHLGALGRIASQQQRMPAQVEFACRMMVLCVICDIETLCLVRALCQLKLLGGLPLRCVFNGNICYS
jgi:hypothetical protein